MSFSVHNTSYEALLNKINYNFNTVGKSVIDRGNPATASTLHLDNFSTVHYYTYTGTGTSSFVIPTYMAENGIYEVYFNCSGSTASNNDMRFNPVSSNSSPSRYYAHYQTSSNNIESQLVVCDSVNDPNGFVFDFYPGSYGLDPVGRITIYNETSNKKIRVEAGDTASALTGGGYWLNNSTDSQNYSLDSNTPLSYNTTSVWTTVGLLSFPPGSFTNWRIRVSRIA